MALSSFPSPSLNSTLTHQELAQEAEQILQQIKKVRWDNAQIQNDLGRRTIKTIQASGETCYMGACVDNSLLLVQQLKKLIPAEKLVVGCELFQRKES